jgi:hypothetical protein
VKFWRIPSNFIFDDDIKPNEVTREVADVGAKAFHAALSASKALDLVPRPPCGPPGVVWLTMNAVRVFWRSQGKRRIYTIAKNTAKAKWRSVYEMAKMGMSL